MAQQKTALVTGITGQDGSYLAEFLLERNYRVVGLLRKTSSVRPQNIAHLYDRVTLVYGDLLDNVSLVDAMGKFKPDELYNLASQSYPGESWRLPMHTAEITGLGAHRIFDAVRQMKPDCRVYQASSSEMYGAAREVPQNELTPFAPLNPYAATKLYAHAIAQIYRKSYKMFIACGILFNHESPRRGVHFITQKVTYGAACAKLGIRDSVALNEEGEPVVKDGKLSVGNLEAIRDWGFAGDYVEAMWRMLQQPEPEDFCIGTGKSWTVKQLCETAFSYVKLDWKKHVTVDPRFSRPTETGPLVADASKAQRVLGWTSKTTFQELVATMVDAHLALLK